MNDGQSTTGHHQLATGQPARFHVGSGNASKGKPAAGMPDIGQPLGPQRVPGIGRPVASRSPARGTLTGARHNTTTWSFDEPPVPCRVPTRRSWIYWPPRRAGALVVEWAVRHDGREVLRSHGCGSVADGTELVVRSGAPADTVYEIWQQIDESAAFIRLVHRGTVR